jgi:hypothetical protein
VILDRQQAHAIATGRKTTHHTTNDALRAGARIPITTRNGRETEIVCHATITRAQTRELRDLTRAEAKAEGFDGARGPLNFRRAWLQRTSPQWLTPERTDEQIAQRFHKQCDGPLVTILTITLTEAPDRWMARSSGRLTSHQTTSNPRDAIDELPVPPQEFVDELARQANATRVTDRTQARKEAALERLALALARSQGKRANNTLRAIERMTASLDRDTG